MSPQGTDPVKSCGEGVNMVPVRRCAKKNEIKYRGVLFPRSPRALLNYLLNNLCGLFPCGDLDGHLRELGLKGHDGIGPNSFQGRQW